MPKRSRKSRFTRARRRSRISHWWVMWRTPILVAIVSAGWWFLYRPYSQEQGWVDVDMTFALCGQQWNGAQGCVVDGDTLVLGHSGDRRRIRLTGFDAPELQGACEAESKQAEAARQALHAWLGQGPFEWDGANDPPYDQYGRELRALRRAKPDGSHEYLADRMIDLGLASDNGWGAAEVDWCRQL